jgi:hypothetical protein
MPPVVERLHGNLFPDGHVIGHIEIQPRRSAEPSGR